MTKMQEEKVLTKEQRSRLLKRRTRAGQAGTLGPMMAWNLIFFLFPLVYLIVLSFSKSESFGGIAYQFNLDNYVKVFTGTYRVVFANSLKMAVIVTLLVILISFPYAYFVARKDAKVQSILILLIMIPNWTNSLLRVFALQNLMSTNGVLNTILMKLHVISKPIQMLSTDFAVYFGMIFTTIPFMILPLYSNMQKIDNSILEAGKDLGCTSFQLFWKVIFPISLPGLSSGIILTFIPTVANFFITDMLGGGKSINIGNVIQNQFTVSNNWPLGSAISVILLILSSIVILGCNKWIDMKAHARQKKEVSK